MTEFVTRLAPPGRALRTYNPRAGPNEQISTRIPKTFLDAMRVREEVFVKEQNLPLASEFDADDARCWHWIVYASVVTRTAVEDSDSGLDLSFDLAFDFDFDSEQQQLPPSSIRVSTAQVPVTTIRLIPPPHPVHPIPGSAMVVDPETGATIWSMMDGSDYEAAHAVSVARREAGKVTEEPYIRLGRLATSAPYRGLQLARLIINTALEWAADHPRCILPPYETLSRLTARLVESRARSRGGGWNDVQEFTGIQEGWNGLVLVHAQMVAEKVWLRAGFTTDHSMGVWWEEGIPHIGMWLRLNVSQ